MKHSLWVVDFNSLRRNVYLGACLYVNLCTMASWLMMIILIEI